MPIYATAVQAFRLEHQRLTHDLREKRRKILDDPHYTATERARALAPIESELRTKFEEYRRDIGKQVEKATAEHMKQRPRAVQLRAAFQNPARAVAMRQLAADQPPHIKRELAQLAAAEQDAVAAYGLLQSLTLQDMSDGIGEELRTIGSPAASAAMANLVGALSEAGRFEMDGPFGDVTATPVEALQYANMARALPDFDGSTINLSDSDVERMREEAGLTSLLAG